MMTTSNALMGTYRQADVAFERGEGPYLIDTQGRKYLDFNAGIAVSSLGHAHPRLVAALTEQAGKLWHTSNLYRIPAQERLAEKLVAASFADRVFFTNSGVEAIECSLKTARKYFHSKGQPNRYQIISLKEGFHGRSLAAIAAGGQDKLTVGFGPVMPGFTHVPADDLDAVAAAITDDTAAILAEPIQGEGGIKPLSAEFLQGLRQLCDRHGLLMILDEIQCGMGRTGKLFAHEWAGITPDILAAAKGIGGGFPFGACLATEEAASGMGPGSHGSTYGGNPLAMAVGNAVIDEILAPGFLDQVQSVARVLRSALDDFVHRHHNMAEEVRGLGLMLGMKLRVPNRDFVRAALDAGLLLAPAGDNVVRFLPPLIIGEAQVEEMIERMEAATAAIQKTEGESASP